MYIVDYIIPKNTVAILKNNILVSLIDLKKNPDYKWMDTTSGNWNNGTVYVGSKFAESHSTRIRMKKVVIVDKGYWTTDDPSADYSDSHSVWSKNQQTRKFIKTGTQEQLVNI